MEKFFVIKAIESKDTEENHCKTVNFLAKNFDKYFVKHSVSSTHLLNKLQMMVFYNIQPPQASIINNHDPVFENSEYELNFKSNLNEDIYIDKNNFSSSNFSDRSEKNSDKKLKLKIVENKENYKRYYENPFESRLKKKPDIIPNQNMKIEIIKSNKKNKK